MTKKKYITLVLILGALTALVPFSIDMYLPGFPAIAKSFGIGTDKVTLSLSSFFIGIALGQILYGPLLDRFGRKPPLYAGLALYLAATAGCYFSHSIGVLVVLRFVQALGGCAAGVVSMAMVRDLFPVEDNAKIFSLLLLVLGSSPMIAPTAGGAISGAFGWHAIFIALFLLGLLILLAVYFILPESRPADASKSLKPGPILVGFWQVLKVPQFITYAVGGSIAFSGLFAYVSASPTIFMEGYKVSGHTYSWLFTILAIGFVGVSQFNRVFAKYFKPAQIILCAMCCMVIAGAVLLCGLQLGWFGMYGTAVMIFIFLSCVGILTPNASALAMAPFEDAAGTAASLFGLIQWVVAGLSSVVVSLFKSNSPVPLAGIMTVSAVVALLVLVVGGSTIKQKVAADGNVAVLH